MISVEMAARKRDESYNDGMGVSEENLSGGAITIGAILHINIGIIYKVNEQF